MEGKILKQLRELHNMTQKELADKVQVTPKAISFYELNQREPSNELLKSFSQIFNVSVDYLLGNSYTQNSEKPKSKAEELEEDFPEGVSVLYRANKNLTPEQKEVMLRMIKATFFEEEESK
ncbi:helix-turn-helix domain-containing protein [Peptoniphilus rhinitidis]|uniref:helix-turn-helix domain-containing protein n=1 Tax=Peptoniphilus rhinitidis TaxID=1175452 RepID=UPI00206AFB02|nr:helix-turn-helix transcriptional regulator [Peptoniphilus rhinitidis]MDU5594392.1 helix-turn-helix transcriptional regulator [Peptoniphilus rhinitidis]DAQ25319.1 MAG TPA: helix-turn-helix domain protein [Caudoviricetes sp.]